MYAFFMPGLFAAMLLLGLGASPLPAYGEPALQVQQAPEQGDVSAIITNITSYMPHCQDPREAHLTHMEDVEFTFRKLTKTHEIASTSESDDWRRMSQG